MNKKVKLPTFVMLVLCMLGLFVFDSDLEKIVYLLLLMMFQMMLYLNVDENHCSDTPVELIGKSFLYKNQKYKILWYFYQREKEVFGVKNLKTKKLSTWQKQELYKAIAIEDAGMAVLR